MVTFTRTDNSVKIDFGNQLQFVPVDAYIISKEGRIWIAIGDHTWNFLPTDINGRASDDADVVAEWLRDNFFFGISALAGGGGPITSGAVEATVLDYTNSNPLAVRLTDTNGDYIAAGAGTQYTEDAAAAANPVGTAPILVRTDTPAPVTTTDGDNVAQRGTNYGAAYTQIVTSSGAFVDSFGGGTQYTEGDTDATITGTALMLEGAANTLVAAPGTAADGLLVNLGTNNDVSVSNTVTVQATDLDVRNLVFATDKIDASGTVLGAGTNNIGDVDVLTLPSIPAGTNNIGDVDVLTLPSIPAGNNNIGDVDIASIAAGTNYVGKVRLTDGTTDSTILDLANNNPLTVAIVDGSGDQITSFGGGTQYTEDAAAAANPVGTVPILIRTDTPATQVTTDGDNIAQRATNYGAAYVQVVSSTGAYVDTFGGGTQYTEGDVDATITGTAMLMEVAANTLQPIQGTVADGLLVNLGANNDVAVTGTVTANLAAGTNNIGDVDIASIAAGDNNIGNVDIVTMPNVVIGSGTVTTVTSLTQMNGQAIAMGTGTRSAGTQRVTIATDDIVPASQSGTWTVQPGNTANTTPWLVSDRPAASGGLSKFHLVGAATTNATNVKASAGQVYAITAFNLNAAPAYLKFHNTSGTPTAGSGVTDTYMIPGNTSGAGLVINIDKGIAFSTGIGITIVTGIADSNASAIAASEVVVNIYYA